jgi:hypothetical protein
MASYSAGTTEIKPSTHVTATPHETALAGIPIALGLEIEEVSAVAAVLNRAGRSGTRSHGATSVRHGEQAGGSQPGKDRFGETPLRRRHFLRQIGD